MEFTPLNWSLAIILQRWHYLFGALKRLTIKDNFNFVLNMKRALITGALLKFIVYSLKFRVSGEFRVLS